MMTFAEFRAWMDGFSEAIVGAPTEEQWKKIQDRLATVTPPVVQTPTYHVPKLNDLINQKPDWNRVICT